MDLKPYNFFGIDRLKCSDTFLVGFIYIHVLHFLHLQFESQIFKVNYACMATELSPV